MMHMLFHSSVKETILFQFWIIDDVWSLLISMFSIFLLSLSYEGLKFYREYLYRKTLETVMVTVEQPKARGRKNQKNESPPILQFAAGISGIEPNRAVSAVIIQQTTCSCPPTVPCETPMPQEYSVVSPREPPTPNGSGRTVITIPSALHQIYKVKMFSWPHALQLGLHMAQVLLSYILMLIFMTFHVWLCTAVILGAGTGFFFFGWKKAVMIDIAEHCS